MAIAVEKIAEGVKEMRSQASERNFTQSIELAVNLKELDLRNPDNRINEEIVLPRGRGRELRIGVIAGDEMAHQAKGIVDRVITSDELEELAKDKKAAKKLANDIDFFIAEPDLMPKVGRLLGPILGPRGKIPKPLPPGAPLEPTVKRLKNTVRLVSKDRPVVHVAVGTEKMSDEEIAENVEAVLSHLEGVLEKGFINLDSVYLKCTMGLSVRLEAN